MNPGHSITKGYPYEKVISQERFKNRIKIILDRRHTRKNKDVTELYADPLLYPDYKPATWLQRFIAGKIIDFLEFRIFDYAEALMVAESQIQHILEEQPFLPEDFGFIKTVGPKDVTDNPTKIYTSKYNDKISLFQNDEEDNEWVLLTRRDDGSYFDTKLQIPNHRIAYALFYGLNVKVEDEKDVEVERDEKAELKSFRAEYSDDIPDGIRAWTNLKAFDEVDAREKAKYIFETGEVFSFEVTNPEKIIITNN